MAKTGRPPTKLLKWLEPENLIRVEGWAKDGLTDEQIAEKMGIVRSTLNQWKKKSEIFSTTLKRGKEVVDREVENSLLKRALGYEYEEKTTEIFELPDGTTRKHVKKTVKIVVPDVTAQIFWLKNRKPDEWRDKREIDTSADAISKLDSILGEVKKNAIEQQAK